MRAFPQRPGQLWRWPRHWGARARAQDWLYLLGLPIGRIVGDVLVQARTCLTALRLRIVWRMTSRPRRWRQILSSVIQARGVAAIQLSDFYFGLDELADRARYAADRLRVDRLYVALHDRESLLLLCIHCHHRAALPFA